MEVVVGKLAGFCIGVENAVNTAENLLNNQKIYCYGELVHNKQVIEKLEAKGMKIIENLDEVPDESVVLFRAHGVRKEDYEKAKIKNLKIYDATCGNVKLIHKKISDKPREYFTIIIGIKDHPEVIGSSSFSENSFVVEKEDDILDAYIEYEKSGCSKVFVVAQTTFSSRKFDELLEEIYINFAETEVEFDKTICLATENRQAEMRNMSKEFETIIIIGGENSSNTKKLAEIAKENCKNVYFIQVPEQLKNINFKDTKKVGIMAGASTPKDIIEAVKNAVLEI